MPKPDDISDLTIDELTDLIDQATNLRTTKYEDRRRELIDELRELETRIGEPTKSAKKPKKQRPRRHEQDSKA